MTVNPNTVEQLARSLLNAMDEEATMTTVELAAAVARRAQLKSDDLAGRGAIFTALDKLGAHARDMCDLKPEVATKGFNKGKTVNRRIWKHLASADVPQTRRDDRQPATSLLDRVHTLEERVADIEARFNPLSRVL